MPDKKDMSADELIKQLNKVLGIDSDSADDDLEAEINEEIPAFDVSDKKDDDGEAIDDTISVPAFDTSVFDDIENFDAESTLSDIFADSSSPLTATLDTLDDEPREKKEYFTADDDITLFPSFNESKEDLDGTVIKFEKEVEAKTDIDSLSDKIDLEKAEDISDSTSEQHISDTVEVNKDASPSSDAVTLSSAGGSTQEEPENEETKFADNSELSDEENDPTVCAKTVIHEDAPQVDEDILNEFNQTYEDEQEPYISDQNGYSKSDKSIMNALENDRPHRTTPQKQINLGIIFDDEPEDQKRKKSKEEKKEQKRQQKVAASKPKIAPVAREFVSSAQRKDFTEDYKKRYRSLRRRTGLLTVFTVLILLFEVLGTFIGGKLPHFINTVSNPKVFVLMLLQLLLICVAFAYKSIFAGFRALFSKNIKPEALTALSVFFTLIYGIYTAISVKSSESLVLFFSPCALCLLCTLMYRKRNLKREVYSFNVISSVKIKYVLEKYIPTDKTKEENEFYDYLPEDAQMLKINKTQFIDNFVAQNSTPCRSKKSIRFISILLILLFIGVFSVLFVFDASASVAIKNALLICCTSLPCAAFAGFSLPFFKSVKNLSYSGSTFIGESAVDEFEKAYVVSFEDKEVFPAYAVKTDKITAYEGYRTDYVIHILMNVFKKVGGPLSTIFTNIAKEVSAEADVNVLSTSDDGIEAMVGNDYVLVGSSRYMKENNFAPEYSDSDRAIEENNEKRIMFVASNGNIIAKLYIKYSIDHDFLHTLSELAKNGMCVAIKTFDPNIDTNLLSSEIDISKYPVRVLKGSDISQSSEIKQSATGNIVSNSSVKSLSEALSACKKTGGAIRTNLLITILSFIIGAAISIFAIATHLEDKINSIHLMAYQLLCIITTYIASISF